VASKKPKDEPPQELAPEREALSYVAESRRLSLSVVAILPLVLLYQVAIVQRGSPTRNIAEVWMTGPLSVLGLPATVVMNAMMLAALLFALWKLHSTGPISIGFLLIMLLESSLYALLMFSGVVVVTEYLIEAAHRFLAIGPLPWNSLLLSLGAAVYEELLFRLLLIGVATAVLHKVFMWSKFWTGLMLLVVSSLLFAGAHHMGVAGEEFDVFVFVFRALCGVALGLIFLCRGLGIAVWTHAAYNVLAVLFA